MHSIDISPAVGADHFLIKHIQRRAEFCSEILSVKSAYGQMAFFIYGQVII